MAVLGGLVLFLTPILSFVFRFFPLEWREKEGLKQSQSKALSRWKLCSGMEAHFKY